MKNRLKTIVVLAFAAAFMLSTSACNRGMGCPTNFSLGNLVHNAR
jgi:hypothetical protein